MRPPGTGVHGPSRDRLTGTTLRRVTLTQLEAFVLVARLGSVKAAARALGVTEPAVSGALAALRQHLGDPLVVRTGGGMDLTEGGRRLVPVAAQMVRLGREAVAAVRQVPGGTEPLRVVATDTVATYVARPLLDAFTARHAGVDVVLSVAPAGEMPHLLTRHLADVALGPRLRGLPGKPVLRYRLVVVAAPDHRLAGATRVDARAVVGLDWLVDATGADPTSEVGALLARLRVPAGRVRVFPSLDAAWSAAAAGAGVAPAIAHLVARDVERGRLAVLAVTGTPVDLLWHATTLGAHRRAPAADRLDHFLDTPAAVQAVHDADGSVPAARFRPPVHVTLWS